MVLKNGFVFAKLEKRYPWWPSVSRRSTSLVPLSLSTRGGGRVRRFVDRRWKLVVLFGCAEPWARKLHGLDVEDGTLHWLYNKIYTHSILIKIQKKNKSLWLATYLPLLLLESPLSGVCSFEMRPLSGTSLALVARRSVFTGLDGCAGNRLLACVESVGNGGCVDKWRAIDVAWQPASIKACSAFGSCSVDRCWRCCRRSCLGTGESSTKLSDRRAPGGLYSWMDAAKKNKN